MVQCTRNQNRYLMGLIGSSKNNHLKHRERLLTHQYHESKKKNLYMNEIIDDVSSSSLDGCIIYLGSHLY